MSAQPTPEPSGQRRWRNFLLDRRLQLRFTAYSVAMALLVAALLGGFLWNTSRRLMEETAAAVEARGVAADQSRDLGNTALSNELLRHMNDPAFEAQLKARSQAIDREYELERAAIIAQRERLLRSQRLTWLVLVGVLAAFVLFIALFSIVATHRIVGPVYRVRRMLESLAEGRVQPPSGGLRQGDELTELFEAASLLATRMAEHERATVAELEGLAGAPEAAGVRPRLLALVDRLRARLAP